MDSNGIDSRAGRRYGSQVPAPNNPNGDLSHQGRGDERDRTSQSQATKPCCKAHRPPQARRGSRRDYETPLIVYGFVGLIRALAVVAVTAAVYIAIHLVS